MFIALSAQLGHGLFSGDAKDAFAHSPPPETPTFVQIDDTYNFCLREFKTEIEKSLREF